MNLFQSRYKSNISELKKTTELLSTLTSDFLAEVPSFLILINERSKIRHFHHFFSMATE